MKLFFLVFFVFSTSLLAKDNDFLIYYQSFKTEALKSNTLNNQYQKRLLNVQIRYSKKNELPPIFKGYCLDKENTVIIDKDFFKNASKLLKQRTIDHELGHCVLLRSHYNLSNIKNGEEIPTTIMHATIYPYLSIKEMNQMRKDLFKPEFYGTSNEVSKKYTAGLNELSLLSGYVITDNFYLLRNIEHNVMEERIQKYLKSQNKK